MSILLDRKLSLGNDVWVVHGICDGQSHRCGCLQRGKLAIGKAFCCHRFEGPGLDEGCNDQVQHKAHDEEPEDLHEVLGLDQLSDSGLQAHSLQFTTEKKYVGCSSRRAGIDSQNLIADSIIEMDDILKTLAIMGILVAIVMCKRRREEGFTDTQLTKPEDHSPQGLYKALQAASDSTKTHHLKCCCAEICA